MFALGAGVGGAAVVGAPFNPFGTHVVGSVVQGRLLLNDNQWVKPYGRRTTPFTALMVGTAVSPNGMNVAVQTGGEVTTQQSFNILDAASGSVDQTFQNVTTPIASGGVGLAPPTYSPDGTALYSATLTGILRYAVGSDGLVTNPDSPHVISLGSGKLPYGLAVSSDGTRLYVALSGTNDLGVIDTTTNELIHQIPVGNAPAAVAIVGNEAFVANRGGRPAVPGDTTETSDGTPIVDNPVTGASTTGTVSVVDLATNRVTDTINVGLQPAALTVHRGSVFVTNTNSDTVSIIDAASHQVTQTFNVNPLPGTTVGASPNSVTFSDPNTLLVSVGRDNAIAEFAYNGPTTPVQYKGLIPTDWYPNQVSFDPKVGKVIVSNEFGIGTDGAPTVYQSEGTVTSFRPPSNLMLGSLTRQVFDNNGWHHLPASNQPWNNNGPGERLPAIPTQLGEPSAIKHVFLIIKENRSYDQVLGDIGKGNSQPYTQPRGPHDLGPFDGPVDPNFHSLANTFTLFDNFYEPNTESTDGHQWLMQADANDYMEQDQAANWARSFPYGSGGGLGDSLAYQRDGFIWDDVKAAGKTVKDYGEFDNAVSGTVGTWQQYYADSQILEGKATGPLPIPINSAKYSSDIPSLNRVVYPFSPNFNLDIPDQYRVDVWNQDFRRQLKTNSVPNLTIMWILDDHTGGVPTPNAEVADNDLAVGRIVSDISHSSVWKSSAVFSVEDDSITGSDHVDGHHGPLFIASPYVKRGVVNSDYFTTSNVLKTIEQILGAKPMNQVDLAAEPMFSAFTNIPNLSPYHVVPNNIPLTQGVTGLIPQTPTSAFKAANPKAAAALAATKGPPAPPVPAKERSVAAAWAIWKQTEVLPKLTGPHAVADSVNPAQMSRYDWYSGTRWTKPYPGDKRILTPDQVPGRNVPTSLFHN
jgi:YVTN family beta-propeller protein